MPGPPCRSRWCGRPDRSIDGRIRKSALRQTLADAQPICYIRSMDKLRLVCLLFSFAAGTVTGAADQTDPRLGSLFQKLKTASEPADATSVEAQIWAIWLDQPDTMVDSLMKNGIEAMTIGDHQSALTAFDQVVALAPDFAEGWNKRATVHYLLNNLQESLADIDTTLKLEPRHFGALSGRGLVHVKLGDFKRALSAFEAALEVSPQSPGPRANAEAIRDLLGQRDI